MGKLVDKKSDVNKKVWSHDVWLLQNGRRKWTTQYNGDGREAKVVKRRGREKTPNHSQVGRLRI